MANTLIFPWVLWAHGRHNHLSVAAMSFSQLQNLAHGTNGTSRDYAVKPRVERGVAGAEPVLGLVDELSKIAPLFRLYMGVSKNMGKTPKSSICS